MSSLANSLIENGFDAHDQIKKYIKWKDCGSTNNYDSGNGGIMRIAPIPMYFKNYDDAIKYGY